MKDPRRDPGQLNFSPIRGKDVPKFMFIWRHHVGVHPDDDRKPTEYVTEFCYYSVNSSLKELIAPHLIKGLFRWQKPTASYKILEIQPHCILKRGAIWD